MIQVYRRELTDPFNLDEWVLDTLAFAYDQAGVEVSDEGLGVEAGCLVAAAAGTPAHPGTPELDAEFNADQVMAVFDMTLERVMAIKGIMAGDGSPRMKRVRLKMQSKRFAEQVTSAGS